MLQRSWSSVAVTGLAVALAFAASLPAVWWEPLHLDERVMLEYAPHAPRAIVREIFVDRGGAPLQFLVEHVTLAWPGGLVGLRLPSLLFFLLAVAWAGPVVGRLVGPREGWIAAVLLALAPLAVELATFARMYALLLWLVLVTAWLSLRAATSGERRDWLLTGALAGGLVYAHPIAPLYALPAFACGLAVDRRPWRESLRRARPGAIAAVLVALPYVYALGVLRSRYGIGEAGPLATTAGRSVPEQALYGLTPEGGTGLAVMLVLAAIGAVLLLQRRHRTGALLLGWVALPILFFTAVPAQTRFFDRYVLAALPAFLALAAAGAVAIGRRPVVVAALAAVLLALEAADDVDRLRRLHALDLGALPRPASGQVLFSSTGLPRADRPPELLDDLLALETAGETRVEELPAIDPRFDRTAVPKGVAAVSGVAAAPGLAQGLWVFRGNERRVAAAKRRLDRDADLTARRVGRELLVVGTRRRESHRRLVELGARIRGDWGTTTPLDRWPRTIQRIDRVALG